MDYIDKKDSLTPVGIQVICERATEAPHTGKYNHPFSTGTYLCRRCGLGLFKAKSQFNSHCGWPSFDETISNSVIEKLDTDGIRVEICCRRCQAHLGHVFEGEHYTAKNIRYCVNSLSIDLVLFDDIFDTAEIIIAGGCFWGVDFYMHQVPGVVKTESGFIGGKLQYPTYEQICQGDTGFYEAVRVVYDKDKTDCEQLYRYFFEIHDPTQRTGQGPDLGTQYQSAIFYYNQHQVETAEQLIKQLQQKGYAVATQLLTMATFWPADDAHQDYYLKHHKMPYCHKPVARFT